MTKLQQMQKIEHSGIVGIIRASNPSLLIEVVDAMQAGGIDVIEITMTTPNALGVLEEAVTKTGDGILFGVGSVLDAETEDLHSVGCRVCSQSSNKTRCYRNL